MNEEIMIKAQLYDMQMKAREEMLSHGFHEIDGMFFTEELAKEYMALKVKLSVVSSSIVEKKEVEAPLREEAVETQVVDEQKPVEEPVEEQQNTRSKLFQNINGYDEEYQRMLREKPELFEPEKSLRERVVDWAIATREQVSQISSMDYKAILKQAVAKLKEKWKNLDDAITERHDNLAHAIEEKETEIFDSIQERGKQIAQNVNDKVVAPVQSAISETKKKFFPKDDEVDYDELKDTIAFLASEEDLQNEGRDLYVQRRIAGPQSLVKWAFDVIKPGQTRDDAYRKLVPDNQELNPEETFVKITKHGERGDFSTYGLIPTELYQNIQNRKMDEQTVEVDKRR